MKWTIDSCPDANGNWTIRVDDDTEHGNTDRQPIATVYSLKDAQRIIRAFAFIKAMKDNGDDV